MSVFQDSRKSKSQRPSSVYTIQSSQVRSGYRSGAFLPKASIQEALHKRKRSWCCSRKLPSAKKTTHMLSFCNLKEEPFSFPIASFGSAARFRWCCCCAPPTYRKANRSRIGTKIDPRYYGKGATERKKSI